MNHVDRTGEIRNSYNNIMSSLKDIQHAVDKDIDWRIILNGLKKKLVGCMRPLWTGFIWLRIKTSSVFCDHDNEISGFYKIRRIFSLSGRLLAYQYVEG